MDDHYRSQQSLRMPYRSQTKLYHYKYEVNRRNQTTKRCDATCTMVDVGPGKNITNCPPKYYPRYHSWRSEPNSRIVVMGEYPNKFNNLHMRHQRSLFLVLLFFLVFVLIFLILILFLFILIQALLHISLLLACPTCHFMTRWLRTAFQVIALWIFILSSLPSSIFLYANFHGLSQRRGLVS